MISCQLFRVLFFPRDQSRDVTPRLWEGGWFLIFEHSSLFCFFLTEFNFTPCLLKYYHIMFINIPPPQGVVDGLYSRCRLVWKFIHCFGALRPGGKIGLSYSLGFWDFIFSCRFTSMLKCLGKHSCMRSSFPIAILNDTSSFSDSATTCAQRDVRDKIAL